MSHKISIEGSNKWFECDEYEPILECLERNDVLIDCSCRIGVCGVCKVVLINGKVDQEEQGVLTHEDHELNLVLSCSTYPQSDCVVRLTDS